MFLWCCQLSFMTMFVDINRYLMGQKLFEIIQHYNNKSTITTTKVFTSKKDWNQVLRKNFFYIVGVNTELLVDISRHW